MKCESCGKAVPCGSEFCPHCGCVAVSPKKNEKSDGRSTDGSGSDSGGSADEPVYAPDDRIYRLLGAPAGGL